MGNCKSVSASSPSLNSNGNNRKLTLAIVGLDNAGKTVTARCLEGSSVHDVTPTIGFSSVTFSFDKYQISLYDLGGGAKIRNIWNKYYAEVYGFVFVIDASNESRMEECQKVFKTFLESNQVRGKPILILANKQDVEGALDEEDIIDALQLEELANQYKSPCRVESCAARIYDGKKLDSAIQLGFRWLTRVIESDWDKLSDRIGRDVQISAEIEKREKQERMERVQRSRELREQEERKGRTAEDAEEEEDSHHGLDPFKPIDQQLVLSQKREATTKKSKKSRKPYVDSEDQTEQRQNNDSTLQPSSLRGRQQQDLDNGLDSYGRYGDSDDDEQLSGEERQQQSGFPSGQRRLDEVEAPVGRRLYGRPEHSEHSPDYSLLTNRRQSDDGRITTSQPPLPKGSLEPIENGKNKTTKKKMRLRNNRTAPSPDLDNADNGRPASPPSQTGYLRKGKTQTSSRHRSQADDMSDDEESYHNGDTKPFAQRWNLANEDMPCEDNEPSYVQKSKTARQPNSDFTYDLIT